jgi:hypothetical protein
MVALRSGGREQTKSFRVEEQLQFDEGTYLTSSGTTTKSHRTAHTQGRMFGLSFWENWYIIGENLPTEAPFKFVYYTGKTLQNTYSGAFVYSRSPELAPDAMASVYRIAREAGLDPTKFCRIRNACFDKSAASSSVLADRDDGGDVDLRHFLASIQAPLKLRLQTMIYDVLDYINDPHEAARWMFDQQRQVIWPLGIEGSMPR